MSLETSGRRAVVIAVGVIFSAGLLVAQAAPGPGYLGIGFSIDPESGVLSVRQIVPDSPAASVDIVVADEILRVDAKEIRFPSHRAALEFLSKRARTGVVLVLTVRRGGVLRETRIVPEEPPPSLASQNELALRCADGEDRPEAAWSRAFESVP